MATNLPFCFFIQFLEHLLKFLVNFTLLKYVKSQRSYGFLITKELIFGFQILDLKVHFSASSSKYLTDIPRQREEYEVIYGTRRNAECHITSILRAGVEYLFYFMTNSRYIFVTK